MRKEEERERRREGEKGRGGTMKGGGMTNV